MKQIKEINHDSAKELRVAIQTAFDQIKKDFGLQALELATITMSREGDGFKSQVVCKVDASENPKIKAKNAEYSTLLGYDQNIVGENFTLQGRRLKVIEIKIERPKYPIVCQEIGDEKLLKVSAGSPLKFDNHLIKYDAQKNVFKGN